MRFEPLSYADRLTVVNPHGDTGLVTLWSPRRATLRVLSRIDPALLDPDASRLAVIGNLYGDGLHHMLVNLLHNPQIRHLVAVGEPMGLETVAEVEALLRDGVVDDRVLGADVLRVPGTGRVLPALPGLDVDRLRAQLTFTHLGPLGTLGPGFTTAVAALPDGPPLTPRRRVEIPPVTLGRRPSDVGSHQVSRPRLLDAWRELVVRTVRFGETTDVGGGVRRELLNARAVITSPSSRPDPELADHGFSADDVRAYQRRMLDGSAPDGVTYTYGHRLRGHFGLDALGAAIERLRDVPGTRRAYLSLWDTGYDLAGEHAAPCLVAVVLRIADGALTLTATYRAHNLLTAWVPNAYGLAAVQRYAADALGVPSGPLTVISHQLGADPESPRWPVALAVEQAWTRDEDPGSQLREDPHGYFVVTVDADAGEIVAEHRAGALLVTRYRGRRARTIATEVAADMAVSLPSHALWLGGELARAEAALRAGERFPVP